MGVVFFPSLLFMGVMLFPSFVLGNAFGEGGGSLALLSLFFSLSSSSSFLPLLPSFLFSLSHPLFFFKTPSIPFLLLLFSTSLFPVFFSLCLSPLSPLSSFFFFLRELLVLSAFQDVIEDTTDCNRIRFI